MVSKIFSFAVSFALVVVPAILASGGPDIVWEPVDVDDEDVVRAANYAVEVMEKYTHSP